MRRMIFHRPHEKGAIAVIVAVLFGFGVMTAAAALTIDVGNINADRRQLQNGADAVALAVAQQCALTGTCTPTDPNLKPLANANAADNHTSIRRVDGGTPVLPTPDPTYPAICGNATGLFQCQTAWTQSMSNLQECPSDVPSSANYVRVYTETENSVGNHILPYSFGAAIAGVGSSGANQQACATVIWGPPSGAAAPITLSYCEWKAATGYVPATTDPVTGAIITPAVGIYANEPTAGTPGYIALGVGLPVPLPGTAPGIWPTPALQLPAVPVPGNEIIVGLQGQTTTPNCSSWNGHDVPGGFGYLSSTTLCNMTAAVGGWVQVDTGNSLPVRCDLRPLFNTIIYLPVFDCVATGTSSTPPTVTPPAVYPTVCNRGNGNTSWYHIQGYAKFYLSGYKTGGGPSDEAARTNSLATPSLPCSGNDRCLSGWFLKGLVEEPPATTTTPGSPSLGAYSIQLAR
jgi:Flp pilus assembly protein TadG